MAVALDASEFPKVGTTQQKLGPPSLPELFQILFPQHSEPPAGKGWNQAAVAQSRSSLRWQCKRLVPNHPQVGSTDGKGHTSSNTISSEI